MEVLFTTGLSSHFLNRQEAAKRPLVFLERFNINKTIKQNGLALQAILTPCLHATAITSRQLPNKTTRRSGPQAVFLIIISIFQNKSFF